MDTLTISNIVMYYAAAEKLELLYQQRKITKEEMQRAKQYICQKLGVQNEIFDSFLLCLW